MKYIYRISALVGLLMTLVPSFLLFFNVIEASQMKLYLLVGTILWFSGAIPWLGQKRTQN